MDWFENQGEVSYEIRPEMDPRRPSNGEVDETEEDLGCHL